MTTAPRKSRFVALLSYLRGLLLTTLAVVIIATAVIVGVGRVLIPYADELRPWLADTLSERLGEPVRIGRLEAQWPRLTPQLTLYQVAVGADGDPLLEVDQVRLELHLANAFNDQRNLLQLIVLGLDLLLAEDDEGRWGVSLEGGAQIDDDSIRDQVPFGDLMIRDARLRVTMASGTAFGARLVEGDLRRRGERTLISGQLEPSGQAGNNLNFGLLMRHADGRWREGQAWIKGDELGVNDWASAPWLPDTARVSLEAWANWSDELGGRLDADFAVAGLGGNDANLDGSQRLEGEIFASRLDRTNQIELVRLDAVGSETTTSLLRGLAVARRDHHWALGLDMLDLEVVYAWVKPWLPDRDWRPHSMTGRLGELQVGWREAIGLHALEGRVEQLAVTMADRFPSVANLSIDLGLSGDRPVLTPRGQPRVVWASLLKEAVELESLSGRALVSPRAIELDNVTIENELFAGTTDGWLYFGQRRPFLDLVIDVDNVASMDPRRFLPLRYIPPKADEWLNQSLTGLEQATGTVYLHMLAGTKARDIRPGHFQADVEFSGVTIDYWPDWPVASQLTGSARFVGSGLEARIDDARLGNLAIASADLSLPDLIEPELAMTLRSGNTRASSVAGLLAEIPFPVWSRVLEPMSWSGMATVETQLNLPFKQMDDWWVEGEVTLDQAQLELPQLGFTFDTLEGTVGFDRQALGPSTLNIGTAEQQSEVALVAAFADPGWMSLNGNLNPVNFMSNPGRLAGRIQGQSEFRLDLAADPEGGLALSVASDLIGMALSFPDPLIKPRDESWPLQMNASMHESQLTAELNLADWLAGRLRSSPADLSLAVGLNRATPELAAEGLVVRGRLHALALTQWRELFGEKKLQGGGGDWPVDLAVQFDTLDAYGLSLDSVNVELARGDAEWQLDLDGSTIAGGVTIPVPLDSGRVVVADLERLHLDPVQPPPESADLAVQPISSQTSSQSPAGLPPLHIFIEDLRWGDLNLGQARLESHAGPDGVEIELIDVSGPDMRLNGMGRWRLADERTQSEFTGRLTTGNLSGLLESAGYQSGIQAGRTQLEMDFRWPGAPADFELGRLSGVLDLQILDGTIPEARPGAGRLLGLASFNAIPRRLTLDFRDVFGSGLKFDQIQGRFDLAAGFARTNGLVIYSPAANITITGDTDMAARRYDQQIRVEPGLGATLPVIGVLAGGPVGAAAGLVLQSILDRPLRGIAEARYSVTGSWDDPRIELVEARVTDEDGEETVIGPPQPD